jgi:hypothetical protein
VNRSSLARRLEVISEEGSRVIFIIEKQFNVVKRPLGMSNLLILPPSHISKTTCLYHKFSIPGELVRREKFYHG